MEHQQPVLDCEAYEIARLTIAQQSMDGKQNKHGQEILRLLKEREGEPRTHYDRVRAMYTLHRHPFHGAMMESVFQKVESAQDQGISLGEGDLYMNR